MPASLDLTTAVLNDRCRWAQEDGRELSDGEAATVASYWHNGQASAFYAFASSGHYDRDALLRELSDCIATSYAYATFADRLQLDMLGTYLLNRPA
jgi:hypothetical protein